MNQFLESLYMEELLAELLHGPVKPGQGCQVISDWLLNNALNCGSN